MAENSSQTLSFTVLLPDGSVRVIQISKTLHEQKKDSPIFDLSLWQAKDALSSQQIIPKQSLEQLPVSLETARLAKFMLTSAIFMLLPQSDSMVLGLLTNSEA